MKCLYYLAPTLESTRQVTDDLHAAGVKDFFVHVIAKDESGLKHQQIHSSNYLETLDIIRDGFIGAALGVVAGVIGAALLFFFDPFGPGVPRIVYFMIVVLIILFGAWEGGLTGIATENKKLRKFHREIEAGKYVILIYARKEQGAAVRAMMRAKHPEAELVAVTKHFVNPFSAVRRRHAARGKREDALQKDS
ncbi:MAG: hypothetical protein ABI039_13695 [Vicinamibacterales bacterium]